MTQRYEKEMASVTRRLTSTHFERMRSVAIGGASASTAIVLVLLQVCGLTPSALTAALTLSLYAACVAIPAWVGSWQFLEAYIFYGQDSFVHFNRPQGSGIAAGLNLVGSVCLAASLSAAVWHLAPLASVVFFAAGAVVIVLIVRHASGVKAVADAVTEPEEQEAKGMEESSV
jgi:hypothetical protein